MTAVVCYIMPYLINNTFSLNLSFTLDNDVVLRSVLGIPYLLAMGGAIVDLVKGQFLFSELNQVFVL